MNILNLFKKKVTRKPGEPLTKKDLEYIIKHEEDSSNKELRAGFDLIKKYPKSVSILGSARFDENNEYYKQARNLAFRIAKELNYAIVTGGGPGIMEAANRGAFEAGGNSIGINIILPKEQSVNKYVTESANFDYFFTRKTILFFAAESYVYYPGGFGTMDELFEVLTLMQTNEISKAPVILVGRNFWTPLLELIDEKLYQEINAIDAKDKDLYKIVDSDDEILEIIKNAPLRQE